MGRRKKEIILKKQENGCIICVSHSRTKGYTMIWNGQKLQPFHRRIWEEENGPIPEGMDVLHHCDNPACANLEHLFLGTHQDNMADRDSKGRTAKGEHCGGAKLTTDEVKIIREQYHPRDKISNSYILAKKFGVCPSTILNIINRRRWTWI